MVWILCSACKSGGGGCSACKNGGSGTSCTCTPAKCECQKINKGKQR